MECYVALHRLGLAHSVEVWQGSHLVGGLYGVHLGGAFFGESMFHRVPTPRRSRSSRSSIGSRAAGFALLDMQWVTPHLEQFGAIEIPRREYLVRLKDAIAIDCAF